ncbi:MAG: STAS domain-containing protein [bacterium]
MKVERDTIDDIEIFRIQGEYTIYEEDKVYEDYRNLLTKGKYKFIFNFDNLKYIDSAGLATLVLGVSSVLQNKTKIRICCVNETVKNIFDTIHLNEAFEFYPTEQEAIQSFKTK